MAAVDMSQIVIGERVGGEAPVGVALDAARAEAAEVVLKQEIAHGVATLGVVQPIIEASVTTDVSSAATARGSRKRDSRHSAVPALNEEFPINECEVYVPHGRAGKITHHTWELVIGHTDDGIVVQPADEPPSEISIKLLKRNAVGGVFKRLKRDALPALSDTPTTTGEEPSTMELSPSPPPPMPPPSAPRTGRHIKVEYEEHSCSVKDEHEQEAKGGTNRSKDASTLSREALRRALQYEPDGKTPRAVFRAGCHAKCLTQVLGGVGTDMERFVKEDKVLADGHVLIRAGEMYLWGRADWNTYAPSFAGDAGAYRDDLAVELREQQHKMGWAAPQSTFHLFRECTQRFLIDMPLSAYHGKDAEKKTLYCGRYRVADDDEVTFHLYFKNLPSCTQECICELDARREIGSGEAVRAQRERRASEIMAERLQATEFYTLYGVEFVDYDEKLYRALVASGASNGRVDIDDVKLGPL